MRSCLWGQRKCTGTCVYTRPPPPPPFLPLGCCTCKKSSTYTKWHSTASGRPPPRDPHSRCQLSTCASYDTKGTITAKWEACSPTAVTFEISTGRQEPLTPVPDPCLQVSHKRIPGQPPGPPYLGSVDDDQALLGEQSRD
ncbi:hypothetical protein LZ32DRAFT_227160 [Colletotrichum eremochloae]|nr:hypothetical protein LZ32DRAFT_227160 [Colletotrichum eremochloae]